MTLYTLQILRFIAAILVLFFHLELSHSGYKGVDLFFVISGYVIYYTLFYRPRPGAVKFFIHRLTKVFFLYWVALGVLYIVRPFPIEVSTLKTLLLFPGHNAVLGVSWSLSYELYFYCVAAGVTYLITNKYQKAIFILLISVSSFITLSNLSFVSMKGLPINFLAGPNFWEFLLGVFGAYITTSKPLLVNSRVFLSIGIFAIFSFQFITISYNTPLSYVVYGPLSFITIVCFTFYERNNPLHGKAASIFNVLGESSYAIYLFGPLFTILIAPDDAFSKAIVVLSTICFSASFSQFIEKNVLNWSRKILLRDFASSNKTLQRQG